MCVVTKDYFPCENNHSILYSGIVVHIQMYSVSMYKIRRFGTTSVTRACFALDSQQHVSRHRAILWYRLMLSRFFKYKNCGIQTGNNKDDVNFDTFHWAKVHSVSTECEIQKNKIRLWLGLELFSSLDFCRQGRCKRVKNTAMLHEKIRMRNIQH